MNLEPDQIRISPIPKTWLLDLDGAPVIHDGPNIMGKDDMNEDAGVKGNADR